MDRIEALGNQLSQITMYDIKSMYNQVGEFGVCFPQLLTSLGCALGKKYGAKRVRDGG